MSDDEPLRALARRYVGWQLDIRGAARALCRPSFTHRVAPKAPAYFEGSDLDTLDASLRQRLIAAADREPEVVPLPLRTPRLD